MTVTGKVTKEERQGRDGKAMTGFVLTDAAGNKIRLPSGEGRMGGRVGKEGVDQPAAPAVKLDEYVGKDVKIVGKGFERERDGKKVTQLISITKIEVVAAAAEAAPAAAPVAK